MSIIEIRTWQMWKIQRAEIPNRVTGVPSPHITSPAMKIFQIFFYLSLDCCFKLLYDYHDNHGNQEAAQMDSI